MKINHHELNIEQYGNPQAPTILFLHHGLGSTQAWRKQIMAFKEAGYHLIIYDRWGYGASDPRPHLHVPDFKDDLADLDEIINRFELTSLTLIGHSDGGSISLYYAAQNPDSVKALIVVAAHIYLEFKMEPGIQTIRSAFEKDKGFRRGMLRAHGEKYETTFFNWYDGWHTPKVINWDMRPILKKIRCPVLVIQGEEDEHATSQHAIEIAKNIPSADLWLVPGAKHMLPQENPDIFNKKALGFLERIIDLQSKY